MHDPATGAPAGVLIDHMGSRYHDTHRREPPDLVVPSRKVETAHATDPNTPHGLTHALESVAEDIDEHIHLENEVLFPRAERRA